MLSVLEMICGGAPQSVKTLISALELVRFESSTKMEVLYTHVEDYLRLRHSTWVGTSGRLIIQQWINSFSRT